MSEYQYYEFLAVDGELTPSEMKKLRTHSSRAEITSTRFVNVYDYGDFKGNVKDWMQKHFDAFVYVANWGSRRLMFRLPAKALDVKTFRRYCSCRLSQVSSKDGFAILDFMSNDEEGEGSEEDGEGLLAEFLPLRANLAQGDMRALYLAWLSCASSGELDEDALEPPVPAGMRSLSPPLRRFAEFLRIDPALLKIAAEPSLDLDKSVSSKGFLKWVAALPPSEKNRLLLHAVEGQGQNIRQELLAEYRKSGKQEQKVVAPSRTVGKLLAASHARSGSQAGAGSLTGSTALWPVPETTPFPGMRRKGIVQIRS